MSAVQIESLAVADFDTVARWLGRPEINKWLTSEWRGRAVTASTIAMMVRNKRNSVFLVRCDGEPCGIVGLADIDLPDLTAMVWYVLGEDRFARRGVTSAAVRQLVGLAFSQMNLRSIYAWIMKDNTASLRVLEKSGFQRAGRLRNAACSSGKQVDRVYFDVTPSAITP